MKLDMGEQVRERPVFEDAIKEHNQNMKPEMKKELSLETDKKSTNVPQWNIPTSCGGGGGEEESLETLLSQMSLTRQPDRQPAMTSSQPPSPKVRAMVRLVRLALSRADKDELKQLAEIATTHKSRPEFVRHLGKLLDKGGAERAKDAKTDVDDASRRAGGHRATPPPEPGRAEQRKKAEPKRKDLIAACRDENDLCPRSPMRPQHHRPSNFPYQNTSRNHHSGGIMSAVAYSDAIGPTPPYQSHPLYQSLAAPASRPPLVAESSDFLPDLETTLDDLDPMVNLSEGDLQILMSLAADWCPKTSADYEMFPESISEINSTQHQFGHPPAPNIPKSSFDHRVPTDPSDIIEELFPSSCPALETWGAGGGGGGGGYYHDDSTSGCSSLSPNVFSPGGRGSTNPESPGHVVPDDAAPDMSPQGQLFFDDRLPVTTSDYDGYPSKTGDSFHGDRSPGSSGYSSTGVPSPTDYPSADEHAREDFDTKVQNASNDYFFGLDSSDFDSDYLLPEFENVFEASPTVAGVVYPPPYDVPTSQNIPCPIAEFEKTPSGVVGESRVASFSATLLDAAPVVFAPGYAAVYAGADDTSRIRPALQAKQVVASTTSPSVSNLKRLEPKVEHLLRAETGRERILTLMDKKKKAEAWVNISLKINEVGKQDRDGDTQLMILCANTEGGGTAHHYVLEYVYAMVEMLKGVPGALSAANRQGHSVVYLAALHGVYPDRAVVVRYIAETLIGLGEDLGHTTEGGDSILHELCKQGDQRYDVLVELLSLKNQAGQPYFDVNQYNANGLTPLHVAVQSHGANDVASLMTVQLLMAERADILLPEKTESHTALHLAIVKSCAPRLVEALLRGSGQAAGRACNTLNHRRDSPLHCAASRNDVPVAQQTKVIQLLLRHGAVKSLNASGKFPIALVAEERRQEIRRVYETRKGNQAIVGMM